MAAAGDTGTAAGVWSLASGHHQHSRQCLAGQEVPLGTQRKLRSVMLRILVKFIMELQGDSK